MNTDNTNNNKDLSTDIVVVGGGSAGLAASIAAAERGIKDIILLEARPVLGGNSVFPGGIIGTGTQLQNRLGVDAQSDDVYRMAMQYAHWKPNAKLVRTLINNSGDNIRWLEQKGITFDRLGPHYYNQVPNVFHIASGSEKTGAAVVKALTRNCQELGVRILFNSTAKKLLTDTQGRVTGVIAANKEGKLTISAGSVILATGGFAGNKELLKKLDPLYNADEVTIIGMPHRGDGLLMALEIGAVTDGHVTLEMAGPSVPASMRLSLIAERPNTIWVNVRGERFADESLPNAMEVANIIYRQPRKISYSLLDEEIMNCIIRDTLTPWQAMRMDENTFKKGLAEDIRLHAEKGNIKTSSSWDDIGDWIGADPEVVKRTIREYNTYCKQGYDELFLKDRRYLTALRTPPYYAIRCGVGIATTHGGIKVNPRMEALDSKDKPIPGLYAAGCEIAGTDADTYNIFVSGHSFGFALGSGRIAGDEAARHLLENI